MGSISPISWLPSQFYIVSTKRKNANAYSSIDETTQSCAQNTTPQSAIQNTSSDQNTVNSKPLYTWDYSANDIKALIQALQLQNPNNRLNILRKLTRNQLEKLLPLLVDYTTNPPNTKKLCAGLKFIDEDVLRGLIRQMPKEKLLKMMLKLVDGDKQKLIKKLPIKGLKRFLGTEKLKKEDFMKAFQNLPEDVLTKISEAITGIPAGKKDKTALIGDLGKFDKDLLVEGMRSLGDKDIQKVVGVLIKQNEKLINEFDQNTLSQPFEKMSKPEMMKSAEGLDPQDVIDIYDQKLPNDCIALTLTQLDPDKLAEQLEKNDADLLIALAQSGQI